MIGEAHAARGGRLRARPQPVAENPQPVVSEEGDGASPESLRDLWQHPVVLRGILVGRAGGEQQRCVGLDAERRQIELGVSHLRAREAAAEPRQPDQALAVVSLGVRRLEGLGREETVDGRQAGGVRMAPGRDLRSR
jgi:hypothetical protein